MKPSEVLPITNCLNGIGRPIAYYPSIANALESVDAAIFLGQFMYWDGKQADKQGWIYKKQAEIKVETGLSRYEQENARKILRDLSILEEKKAGVPARLYYKFEWTALDAVISTFIAKIPEPKKAKETPPPKEPKEPKAEVPPTILFQMKEAFQEEHLKEYPEGAFDFIPRDWGDLKKIKETLEKRTLKIKSKNVQDATKAEPFVVTDDEILNSWNLFLKALPTYHRKTNFTPGLIYSNFNKIIQDIINEGKDKSGVNNTKSKARSNASDYV